MNSTKLTKKINAIILVFAMLLTSVFPAVKVYAEEEFCKVTFKITGNGEVFCNDEKVTNGQVVEIEKGDEIVVDTKGCVLTIDNKSVMDEDVTKYYVIDSDKTITIKFIDKSMFDQLTHRVMDGGGGSSGGGGGQSTDMTGYTFWYDRMINKDTCEQGWNEDSKNWWRNYIESQMGMQMSNTSGSIPAYSQMFYTAADEALADARARSQTDRARIVGVSAVYCVFGGKMCTAWEHGDFIPDSGIRAGNSSELPDSTGWSVEYKNNDIPSGMSWRDWLYQYGYNKAGVGSNSLTFVVWAVAAEEPVNLGKLNLKKGSGNPSITNGNGCYSLANAIYGVYKDSACTQWVGNLTTNANGDSNTLELEPAYYYVRENQAPRNYEKDTRIYTVKVEGGQTKVVNNGIVYDTPGNDPISIQINKIDKLTGENYNGDVDSLEGAEFTIKYYDNVDGNVSGTPKKTWVIKSKYYSSINKYLSGLDNAYKVSGDDFYYDKNNNVCMPVGTYSVEETKAPNHYVLDNTKVDTTQGIVENNKVIGVVEDSTSGNWKINIGNELEFKEQVARGGAKGTKFDNDLYKTTYQGNANFKGIELAVINESDNHVSVKENGGIYEKEKEITDLKIKVDENGKWTTGEKVLPYGKYKIIEKATNGAYRLNKDWFVCFEIKEDGQMIDCNDKEQLTDYNKDDINLVNRVIRGGIQVEKWDMELNKSEAIGGVGDKKDKGSTLEDVEFTIKNISTNSIMVRKTDDFSSQNATFSIDWKTLLTKNKNDNSNIKVVKPGEIVGKIVTHWNEEKNAYTAETLKDDLPNGTYEIWESKTNSSYLINTERRNGLGENGPLQKSEHFIVEVKNAGSEVSNSENGIDLTDVKDYAIHTVGKNTKGESGNLVWRNQIVRGNVKMTKITDGSSKRMSVPFVIKNLTTGEAHVIVTNENGQFNTENTSVSNMGEAYNHSYNTNGNDKGIIDESGNIIKGLTSDTPVDCSKLDIKAGTWFGQGGQGSISTPINDIGALPYGHYNLQELHCENNIGYSMQNIDFYIHENGATVDLDTVTNDKVKIKTILSDDGEKTFEVGDIIHPSDKVELRGLEIGRKYHLKADLMVKTSKTTGNIFNINGKEVKGTLEFVADDTEMEVYVEFPEINTEYCAGQKLVAFESLYINNKQGTEVLVKDHRDIRDADQTIKVKNPKHHNNIKTGDNNIIFILTLILVLFASGVTLIVLKKRKK